MRLVLSYFVVLVVLMAGDAVWLGWFAHAVFRPTVGSILLDDPRWGAAALFYLFYALGIVVFPLARARRLGAWTAAPLQGALFGFFAYMTYDLTNLATVTVWSAPLAMADTAWGAVLSALGATAGYAVSKPRA